MNKQLNEVRNAMIAARKEVRYQPSPNVPYRERWKLITKLGDCFVQFEERMMLPGTGSEVKPVDDPVKLAAVLSTLTDTLITVLEAYQTFGIAHLAVPAFDEVQKGCMSRCDKGGQMQPESVLVNYYSPNFKKLLVEELKFQPANPFVDTTKP